jgi:leucyl aminopeptidase
MSARSSAPKRRSPAAVTVDWTARIESAVAAVTDGGNVSVSADASAERSVSLIAADEVEGDGGQWLPFTARLGELAADGNSLRVGLGSLADLTAESIRIAGAEVGRALAIRTSPVTRLDLGRLDDRLVRPLLDGIAGSAGAGRTPVQLAVPAGVLEQAQAGLLDAEVVALAQRLVDAPANALTPETAAAWAEQIASRAGLECKVLGPGEIHDQGFGGLEAIGAGSSNGPRLVQLDHQGAPGAPVLSLVGKGITFDSGGLSLKSPLAMQVMRSDVAGAATVLAVFAALSRLDCPLTVHAVLPLAENLPGTNAVRPGDVVTAWNGTQIQILDSDFEGRVVLADALSFAAQAQPDLMVDLATLTYQAEIALGPDIAAVLSPDDTAADLLLSAAEAAGEPMWRLPWAPRYLNQVRTPFGVRNHPLRDSGRALTAALFLGEFVPPDVPWVHCDMAGPAWRGDASVDGATGFGARTLLRLIDRMTADFRS